MSKIKSFSKSDCMIVQAALKKAFTAVENEFGIKLNFGSGKYDPNSFTMKLTGSVVTESGVVIDPHRSAFSKYAHAYGMKVEWLDQSIPLSNGMKAKIVGLNTKAHKMPVLVEGSDGKKYKISEQVVIRFLGK